MMNNSRSNTSNTLLPAVCGLKVGLTSAPTVEDAPPASSSAQNVSMPNKSKLSFGNALAVAGLAVAVDVAAVAGLTFAAVAIQFVTSGVAGTMA